MQRLRSALVLVSCLAGLALVGCNDAALKATPDGGVPPVSGLSPEQAARVVAKVGDRTITVGDYAKSLENLDPYARLRYQSKERRREFLSDLVDIELLAVEARRRGLDKEPEARQATDLVLRDAILAEGRKGVGAPADVPAADVKAYFEAHPDKFVEPEHRRVGVIIVDDKAKAESILPEALAAKTQAEWGALVGKYSTAISHDHEPTPVEMLGDLGSVTPPGEDKGGSSRVPEAVREVAFKLAKDRVWDKVVDADGHFFIVRLNGVTAASHRTLAQASQQVRIMVLQDKIAARDKALEEQLRKTIPVEIDESALASVIVPMPSAREKVPGPPPDAKTADPKLPAPR